MIPDPGSDAHLGAAPAATGALAMVAAVIATLTADESAPTELVACLETLRDRLGCTECSVWCARPGIERLAVAGAGLVSAAQLPAPYGPLANSADGLVCRPLVFAGRLMGMLVLAREAPFIENETAVVQIASDLLALALERAEGVRDAAERAASSVRAMDEQQRFIERIVDSLPVGLYVVDREYRVHAWNRKRETGLQGVLREEALGRTIFEILRRQPAELLRQEFDEVFRTGNMIQLEMESSASGELRTFRVSKIPMRIADTEVTHVITIGEDITEWKRAQERVAQAQRLAALGQLSAGVMHEINNPLATISACAESMTLQIEDGTLADPVRESFGEYTRIIDHEVHRCKRIVDGLLDFGRPRVDARAPVDVNDVVDQTLFLLAHHARFKRMHVESVLDRSLGACVQGNRDQLVQVLMALLLNAADAMDPGGRIRVGTYDEQDGTSRSVVISVRDEGHGIRPEDVARVFEPFFTTKAPGRGTGLGLSIGYGLVAEHGGRIDVESVVGRGSTFRIHLPIAGAT